MAYPGCVSEVVARHISRVGFRPEDLYHPQTQDDKAGEVSNPGSTQQQEVWGRQDGLIVELIFMPPKGGM